jgi:hypothetical protein
MDALEGPIMRRIQDELDKVDIEKLIHEKIPDIEEHARMFQGEPTVDDVILDETNVTPGEFDNQEPFSDSEEDRGQS